MGIVYIEDEVKNRHMVQLLREIDHGLPVVVICHKEIDGLKCHVIPTFPAMPDWPEIPLKSHGYATLAFLEAIQLANEYMCEYFFYFEWDCLFDMDGWLLALWQEHCIYCPSATLSGTATYWNLDGLDYSSRRNLEEFIAKMGYPYPSRRDFPGGKFMKQINGALAWYRLDRMLQIFEGPLDFLYKIPLEAVRLVRAFDYFIAENLGPGDKVGVLIGSHSECGDLMTIPTERHSMVTSGKKLAVHPIKWSD